MRPLVGMALVALVFGGVGGWGPRRAQAQEGGSAEDGIRIGNTLLAPGIGVTTAFDSNVYRSEADAQLDMVEVINPRLRWTLDNPDTFFLLGGDYQLRKYWGLDTSDDNGHRDLDVYDTFGFDFRLNLNQQGKVAPQIGNQADHSSQILDAADLAGLPDSHMEHFSNNLSLGVAVKPRTAFRIIPRFTYDLDDYRTGPFGERERWATGHDLAGRVEVEWRFLPKTFLLFSADFGGLLWSFRPEDNPTVQEQINNSLQGSGDQNEALASLQGVELYDSQHWRFWVGVQGKISQRISVQALFGYANVYFPDDPSSGDADARSELRGGDGVLGRLQLHYRPNDKHLITVGFVRDYAYTYFSNYFVGTSPYVRYAGVIANRVDVKADFAYNYRQIFGDVDRSDHQVNASLGVGFRVRRWFEPWIEYSFLAIPKSTDPDVEFSAHTVQLRLELGF